MDKYFDQAWIPHLHLELTLLGRLTSWDRGWAPAVAVGDANLSSGDVGVVGDVGDVGGDTALETEIHMGLINIEILEENMALGILTHSRLYASSAYYVSKIV